MAPPTIGDILSRVIQRQAPLRTIQSVRPRSITARYLALFMWTLMSSSSSQTRWRRTEVSPKASGFLKKPAMTTQKKRNQMLIFSPSCAGLTRVSTWISGSGPRLSGLNLELALSPLPSSSGLTRGSTCQGREAVGIGDFHPFPPPQEHRAVDPRVKPEDDVFGDGGGGAGAPPSERSVLELHHRLSAGQDGRQARAGFRQHAVEEEAGGADLGLVEAVVIPGRAGERQSELHHAGPHIGRRHQAEQLEIVVGSGARFVRLGQAD